MCVCVLKANDLAGPKIASQMALGTAASSSPLVCSSRCLSLTSPNGRPGMQDSEYELGWQEAARSDVRIALRMAESVAARN